MRKSAFAFQSAFAFEPAHGGYRCPEGQLLAYATTNRDGYRHGCFRSLVKVRVQRLLAAAAPNIRKIALRLSPQPKRALA